ncbi:GHMP family kinase ATP-binding protein, partial [Cellulosimicrobium cellulans]|uniref:GHMP family kinase ATP-binding protein n=1 Tax=Cellulosimicrobium cellulans TaxID=1710 RepID=UPI000A508FCE
MQLGADHVRVTVPATSANLGPGFDALGLALALHDVVEVRALASDEVVVEVEGEGAGEVPGDESHLVVRALRQALDVAGVPRTGLHLTCVNRIPHGRGLGSSAAAVVAGIVAARALVADPAVLDDAAALPAPRTGGRARDRDLRGVARAPGTLTGARTHRTPVAPGREVDR